MLRPEDPSGGQRSGMQEAQGHDGPAWAPPASHQARGTHPPWHEGVSFLQCGGVQLKEGGDVIAMGHSHQAVLYLLPSIPATCAALDTLG